MSIATLRILQGPAGPELHVDLVSAPDALGHEHEDDHRRLVRELTGLSPEELGAAKVVVTRVAKGAAAPAPAQGAPAAPSRGAVRSNPGGPTPQLGAEIARFLATGYLPDPAPPGGLPYPDGGPAWNALEYAVGHKSGLTAVVSAGTVIAGGLGALVLAAIEYGPLLLPEAARSFKLRSALRLLGALAGAGIAFKSPLVGGAVTGACTWRLAEGLIDRHVWRPTTLGAGAGSADDAP